MRYTDVYGAVLDAERIRVLPEKVRFILSAVRRAKVVAMNKDGYILYSIGELNGKVVYTLNIDVNTKDNNAFWLFLKDAYELAKELKDKTTIREIEEIVKLSISLKSGIPREFIRPENVETTLNRVKMTDEEISEVKEFLKRIKRAVMTIKKSKKLIEGYSYGKGFTDGVEFLSRVNVKDDGHIVIGDVEVEVDDDYYVKRVKVGGEWLDVAERVHVSEVEDFITKLKGEDDTITVELDG